MRKIIITVKEAKNGKEAIIDINHSSDGQKSDLEFITVQMLNEFIFMKVDEIAKSKPHFKSDNANIQYNEVAN
jgi:hypothetical protein